MLDNTRNCLNQRAFAATIRTYNADKVIGIDVEVGVLEGHHTIVADADIAQRDYGIATTHCCGRLSRLHAQSHQRCWLPTGR